MIEQGARAQLYLFVVLSTLVLTLSIDILGLIGVGDPKSSKAVQLPESKTAAWAELDDDGRALLEKEHETIVAEIRLRIEQEHLLFSLKFVLVGAILWAFLQTSFGKAESEFQRTPFAALAAWAAVLAAAIVDLRVMTNQTFLITLGGWVRQYEHLTLGTDGVQLGWEAFLADNLLSKSHYPALRVNGQILTVLLFCVTAFLFLIRPDGRNDPSTARISGASGIVAISLMTIAALSFRHANLNLLVDLAAGALAAVIVAFMARRSHRNYRATGGS